MNPKIKRESVYKRVVKYSRYPRFAIYAIIILYVFVTWANIPFPLLNPPPRSPDPYNWTFTYPSSPPNSLSFGDSSNMIAFQVTVSAKEPFADGADIQVNALGSAGQVLGKNVSRVTVGFLGAYPYGLKQGAFLGGSPFAGAILEPTLTRPNGTIIFDLAGFYLVGSVGDIDFRSYGEFSLTIQIIFNNFSDPITYTYHDFTISLQSSESLRQSQINYSVGASAFGGFLFVVFDLIPKLASKPIQQNSQKTNENPSPHDRPHKPLIPRKTRKVKSL